MWRDLLLAARMLRRSPLFTAVAALSLALGIGATTALFSVMDQVMLRLLPVRDPGHLVLLHRDMQLNGRDSSDDFESVFSYPMYRALRDRDPAFGGNVIVRASAGVALLYRGDTKPVSAEIVSGNFFQTLGVEPALGRLFTPGDDRLDAAPAVVLNHAFWVRHFGADKAVLKQTVNLNGHAMNVIGVSAESFNGLRPGSTPELYVPVSLQKIVKPTWDALEDPTLRWLNVFARVKSDWSIARAKAATDVAYKSILEEQLARFPNMAGGDADRKEFLNHRLTLRPATQGINGLRRDWEKPLYSMAAMVSLLLLIACANVASLLLARAAGRRRETSIRLALGASRWSIVRQMASEAAVLSGAASLVGVLLAYAGVKLLIAVLPHDFAGPWLGASLSPQLLAFAIAVGAVCCLFFSLAPLMDAAQTDLADALKTTSLQVAGARGGTALFRKIMVAAQVALSLTLLAGAALFSQSLFSLLKVQLGFRPERLLTVSLDATQSRPEVARAIAFYRELEERLNGLPGVLGAAGANSGPFSHGSTGGNITVQGYQPAPKEDTSVQMVSAGPNFFHALGIPLRGGRDFAAGDNAAGPKVVIVNEEFARHFFRGKNPLGFRIMFGSHKGSKLDRQIVGVVNDIRKDVRDTPSPTVFYPYMQWQSEPERLVYYLRSAGDEGALAGAVRKVVHSIDSTVPMEDPESMTLLIRNSIYSDRLLAFLAAAFAVLATVLAAVGLYGVIGYVVARRTSEIGVRVALGAVPGDVLRMVLLEAGRLVGIGIAAGVLGSLALGQLVRAQLYGVSANNPVLLAGAAAVLALVAGAAALIPAWRASRIDPITALKYE